MCLYSRLLSFVGNRSNSINCNIAGYGSISLRTSALFTRKFSDKSLINMNNNRRVLSIQSHVVFGYAGNKSATFPLQVLGFEVDPINSVQFSNHTGYDHIKGQVLTDIELGDLFTGLQENNLLIEYSHLLTGYIGKDSFLRRIGDIVKNMRKANPKLIYVCDPVMGDNGELYVPENLLPIYQNEIIPLADICTPNQFELERITGKKIHTETDAWDAMDWFHKRNVSTVVLSSTDFGPADKLIALLSHKKDDKYLRRTISIPKQGNGMIFVGTGDLFASLFLAHSTLSTDLTVAFEKTTASLQAVIKNTLNSMTCETESLSKIPVRYRELKIVQSKNDIEHPNVELFAKKI